MGYQDQGIHRRDHGKMSLGQALKRAEHPRPDEPDSASRARNCLPRADHDQIDRSTRQDPRCDRQGRAVIRGYLRRETVPPIDIHPDDVRQRIFAPTGTHAKAAKWARVDAESPQEAEIESKIYRRQGRASSISGAFVKLLLCSKTAWCTSLRSPTSAFEKIPTLLTKATMVRVLCWTWTTAGRIKVFHQGR